jgi:hypothetical protein
VRSILDWLAGLAGPSAVADEAQSQRAQEYRRGLGHSHRVGASAGINANVVNDAVSALRRAAAVEEDGLHVARQAAVGREAAVVGRVEDELSALPKIVLLLKLKN